MNRLPDELQAEIDAEIEAAVRVTIGKYYEPRINDKRQELEALESEYSQAVERYVERLRGGVPRNGSRRATPKDGTVSASPSRGDAVPQNGPRDLPTRREMLMRVLPDFGDRWFMRRDADAKILDRWPEAEPKTPTNRKTFAAANAAFLKDLVKQGRLEAKEGVKQFDPTQYRVMDNDEGTLLRSGP